MSAAEVVPGVWGVLATPFAGSTLDVDDTGISTLVEHAEGARVTGLTVLGVFGEAARLSWAERRLVLETILDTTGLPAVVGCTGLSTAPVIDETRMAVELMGDRLAAVMVQANSADPRTLDDHLRAIHATTGAKIVLQDYPVVSGVSVPPSVLADVVSRSPHVVAVKAEAPPTAVAVSELVARCDVPVFGGLGGINLLDELACGAAGAMTGFSFPEALVATVNAWDPATPGAARRALVNYLPLIAFEQQANVALAIRKECLRHRGLIGDSVVRPPARALPASLRSQVAIHVDAVDAVSEL